MRRETGSLIALAFWTTLGTSAWADVFGMGVWPQTPPLPGAKTCGMHIVTQHHGVVGAGYMPIEFVVKNGTQVAPPKPTTVERRFKIIATFSLGTPYSYRGGGAASLRTPIEVVIPAGATEGKATALVPVRSSIWQVGLDTYEDDRHIAELSGMSYVNMGHYQTAETAARYLFIADEKCADILKGVGAGATRFNNFGGAVATLQSILGAPGKVNATNDLPQFYRLAGEPPNSRYGRTVAATAGVAGAAVGGFGDAESNDSVTLSALGVYENVAIKSAAELPTNWLALTRYDLICLSREEWDRIAKDSPGKAAALIEWLANGGRLLIHGVDVELDLASLERSMTLVPPSPRGEERPPSANWSVAVDNSFAGNIEWEKAVGKVLEAKGFPSSDDERTPVWTRAREAFAKRFASTNAESRREALELATAMSRCDKHRDPKHVVLVHRKGLGRVFAASHPKVDAEFVHAKTLIDAQGRFDFMTRHGFSCETRNRDFWNFLIPGVGLQPVYSFLAMITLFVIAIGPLNYWLLWRAKRLSLLLFTVPAGAAALTFALFAFATVSDGFGVKMRARTFTAIDQRTGEASVVARQSYYAGVAPSAGLSFDDKTFVYPVDYEPLQASGRSDLLWDEDRQWLRFGWLGSRSLRQFAVARTTTTSAGLEISENGDPPVAVNRLGAKLKAVVLCDRRGGLHYAMNVKPGETIAWKPIAEWIDPDLAKPDRVSVKPEVAEKKSDPEEEARTKSKRFLMSIYEATRPKYPENYDPDQHESWMSMRPRYGYYGQQADVAGYGPMSSLEEGIDRATLRAQGVDSLPHRTYVAFAETTPQGEGEKPLAPIGVPSVTEYGSLHVVRGTW